ncbi:RNA polymerase-associated protein RapA [Planctomycetaceae bacterium]|nr:RNA polymerase-associated protein RapA [Planctomycetaceae bacterium]
MTKLEDIKIGTQVLGLVTVGSVRIASVEWYGQQAIKVIFEHVNGTPESRLIYRRDEERLQLVSAGKRWAFDADAGLLKLAAEATRVQFAHLFDPFLAVHTSKIDALPHQISAVYGELLWRSPLRFLLADDPGAGKTIMAGLFIKELLIRGDLERCLVVAPGNLVEQWQDELFEKFELDFKILTREQIHAARTGNPLQEMPLLIARMDMLSRNEDFMERIQASPEWDLVVVDEAHKMSASRFGNEVKFTKRYRLGEALGARARHLLLMTATPHNGKSEDFELFMALLDADRFEGRSRDGGRRTDVSDMMRRMIKEDLYTFDNKRLFPERRAYTVTYKLSPAEGQLYADVTEYVSKEMNRVERFAKEDDKRRINVGFALQTLQRRLASSPLAIYRSIARRRERLEKLLEEERASQRGGQSTLTDSGGQEDPAEYWEELDEAPEAEVEQEEARVVDLATAARTIQELETEIRTLRDLEAKAKKVLQSNQDTKWQRLQETLDEELMRDATGTRRKLIVFTEPRDTVEYLTKNIEKRIGRPGAVVVIHGGVNREERRKAVEAFQHDKEVVVMVANDAACEGINLQRAHLMVNYDLPWNPNKLEQRFGRIHRIKQTEVCHVWNLVAIETREGEVFHRLLEKLRVEASALQGRVFDVLGQLFEGEPLRDLLMRAVMYGDRPDVKAQLDKAIDNAVDHDRIAKLLEERALSHDTLSASKVLQIRDDLERAEARRLQPHYIQDFFIEAFKSLGGQVRLREPNRWEVTRVPARVQQRDRQFGLGHIVQPKYERICFEKHLVNQQPVAEYVAPGHPLLNSVIDLTLEQNGTLFQQGAILVDDRDDGAEPRVLFMLDLSAKDGRRNKDGGQRVVSKQMLLLAIDRQNAVVDAGPAPYLDYRTPTDAERAVLAPLASETWVQADLEGKIIGHAIEHTIPRLLQDVRDFHLPLVAKIEREVQARLRGEIAYWEQRANWLREQELAGRASDRLNSQKAQQRADELASRLERRMHELTLQKDISAVPPAVRGGCLVVPVGKLRSLQGQPAPAFSTDPDARKEIELLAMRAVMEAERRLGHSPSDVHTLNQGWDIESRHGTTQRLRFIEVKGRIEGATTITVTRNEILRALSKPDAFILAIARIENGRANLRYVHRPFGTHPDYGAASVNYDLDELWARAEDPS